jgi:hypothetical protein
MNAHDLVTSKRGGPGPYRAVEPIIINIINIFVCFAKTGRIIQSSGIRQKQYEKLTEFIKSINKGPAQERYFVGGGGALLLGHQR